MRPTPRLPRAATLAVAALLSVPTLGTAQEYEPAFPHPPAAGRQAGTERWIVHFKTRPFTLDALRDELWGNRDPERTARLVRDIEQRMHAHQGPFLEQLEKRGGIVTRHFWIVNACAIEVAPAQLAAVRRLPNVAYLEPDSVWKPQAIGVGTSDRFHNAQELHKNGIAGEGVAVAIIDSGQDTEYNTTSYMHPTYYNNPIAQWQGRSRLLFNTMLGKYNVAEHGTAVSSCVAGMHYGTFPSEVYSGHAWKAQLAGYTISDFLNGNAFGSTMIAAFQQALADSAANKTRVVNFSYSGSPDLLSGEAQASDQCALVGDILVCRPAGNQGTDLSESPAALNGISVGALDYNHNLASFSCRGYMLDQPGRPRIFPSMVGYGVDVRMAKNDSGIPLTASGTSFASPMIAGAATIVRAANPALKSDETKAILFAGTSAAVGGVNIVTGLGGGYVRDDYAHIIAMNSAQHGRASISVAEPCFRVQVSYKKDDWVKFAIAWHRANVNSRDYSDLNVTVYDGSKVVAAARNGWNTEELVRFQVPADTTYTIEVEASALRSTTRQEFGWACNRPVVGTEISITGQPQNASVCLGYRSPGPIMSVTATNALRYQWRKNTMNLAGETGSALLLSTNLTLADAGVYDCILSNDCEWVMSAAATLTVGPCRVTRHTSTKNGGGFGSVVKSVGDFDGDGYNDYAMGHPQADNGAGHIRVISGKTLQVLFEHTPVAPLAYGTSIAAGDFTDNGLADVIIGAPGPNDSGILMASKCSPICHGWAMKLPATSPVVAGQAVTAGHFNAERGIDGAHTQGPRGKPADTLVAWTFAGFMYRELWKVTPQAGVAIRSIATVGDTNRDGFDDIVIGLPTYRSNDGLIELRSGRNGALLWSFLGHPSGAEEAGYCVDGAGDVDGDGIPDVVAGNPGWSSSRGLVLTLSGKAPAAVQSLFGTKPSERLGQVVAGGGDFNRDGIPDVLASEGGYVRVYSGKSFGSVLWTRSQVSGVPLSAAGFDSNGDSDRDVLIGETSLVWLYDAEPKGGPPAFRRYGATCAGTAGRLARIHGSTGNKTTPDFIDGAAVRIGGQFRIQLTGGPSSTLGLLRLGVSDTWVPLDAIGMPGCVHIVNGIVSFGQGTDSTGTATFGPLSVPNDPGFVGLDVLFQWVVFDKPANAFGLTMSDAARMRFGAK